MPEKVAGSVTLWFNDNTWLNMHSLEFFQFSLGKKIRTDWSDPNISYNKQACGYTMNIF